MPLYGKVDANKDVCSPGYPQITQYHYTITTLHCLASLAPRIRYLSIYRIYLSSDSSEAKTHKSEKLDLKFFTFEKGWLRLAVNTVCVYNWCILFLLGNRPDFPKLTSQRFSVAR